jgi:hypothetical protein
MPPLATPPRLEAGTGDRSRYSPIFAGRKKEGPRKAPQRIQIQAQHSLYLAAIGRPIDTPMISPEITSSTRRFC